MDTFEKAFRTHGDLFRQMGISRMEFATVPATELPCLERPTTSTPT